MVLTGDSATTLFVEHTIFNKRQECHKVPVPSYRSLGVLTGEIHPQGASRNRFLTYKERV